MDINAFFLVALSLLWVCLCSHGISLSATGQEMNMGVMLAESQKLPPATTTEKWQWAQANVERFPFSEKKKLPPHLFHSSLNRRQIWLDPSTTRAFPVQQQRVQFFTEEFATFRVPLKANRKQKTHAMAVFPDNSMHGTLKQTSRSDDGVAIDVLRIFCSSDYAAHESSFFFGRAVQ